jgi:hypothetical protein
MFADGNSASATNLISIKRKIIHDVTVALARYGKVRVRFPLLNYLVFFY